MKILTEQSRRGYLKAEAEVKIQTRFLKRRGKKKNLLTFGIENNPDSDSKTPQFHFEYYAEGNRSNQTKACED